jgi:small-conductance mechanosensitive channel
MAENFVNLTLINMALFFGIIFATFLFSGFIHIIIASLFKNKLEKSTYKMFSRIVTYIIFVIGISFAFNRILQLQLGATLATLGIFGALLILPLIPVLQSIASGFVLALERPFKEEDIIELNGKLCIVKDINLRKTTLRSLSGEIFYVPNVKFITEPVINYTDGEFIKVTQSIDFSNDVDIEKAKTIIENICLKNPNILPNIPQRKITILQKFFSIPKNYFNSKKNIEQLRPKIFIKALSQKLVTVEVWFWIWDVVAREQIISGFLEEIIKDCKKENINFS